MPKQITKTVWNYAELLANAMAEPRNKRAAKAAERARQWLEAGATDPDWWSNVYAKWDLLLESVGFDAPVINFCGFWSQGDGASFTCKSVDVATLMVFLSSKTKPNGKADTESKTDDLWGHLRHRFPTLGSNSYAEKLKSKDAVMSVQRISHHYVHAKTCRTVLEEHEPHDERLWAEFLIDAEYFRTLLCAAIYADLNEEHTYLTSEASLIETSEANGYFFDEFGHRDG